MKKTFYFNLVLITFITGLLFSCSKEKITSQDISFTEGENLMKQTDPSDKNGNISGMIISKGIKFSIILYGEVKTLGPFYLNPDGAFRIVDIPAGTYKFVISWIEPKSSTIEIGSQYSTFSLEVVVESGITTNLDPIYL